VSTQYNVVTISLTLTLYRDVSMYTYTTLTTHGPYFMFTMYAHTGSVYYLLVSSRTTANVHTD